MARHVFDGLIPAAIVLFASAPRGAAAQESPVSGVSAGQSVAHGVEDAPAVQLYIDSDRQGTVFGMAEAFGPVLARRHLDYAQLGVCTAPCVAAVSPADGPFRFVGHQIAPSAPFELPVTPPGVFDVHVHAASRGAYVAGLVLAIDGAAFALVGGSLLVVWAGEGAPPAATRGIGSLAPIGVGFASLGAILMAVGFPLWLNNQTEVEIRGHAPEAHGSFRLAPDGFRF